MAIVADSANGHSCELDPRDGLYVPSSITLTSGRHQHGDWLHLDGYSQISGDGTGTARARLSDDDSPLGSCSQTLFVALRTRR
jgi:hypothetical protein